MAPPPPPLPPRVCGGGGPYPCILLMQIISRLLLLLTALCTARSRCFIAHGGKPAEMKSGANASGFLGVGR